VKGIASGNMIVNFGTTTSSHMPVLMEFIDTFKPVSVIEYGAGLFSSELFAKKCQQVLSLETHYQWFESVQKHLTEYKNFVIKYVELDTVLHYVETIMPKYDLAFVDTQNKIRVALIHASARFADTIICHDTQVPFLVNEQIAGYKRIIFTQAPFKHKNKSRPYTSLWTKREDVFDHFMSIDEKTLYQKYQFPYGIINKKEKGMQIEKKVISFGLWGTNPKYLQGALENARLQPKVYPGWVCRFFIAADVPGNIIDELKSLGCEIVLTKRPGTYRKARYWRIGVAFDPSVSHYIIRDCDSRINEREADAVKEWLLSGKSFHIMRDHKKHTAPIMGGMWGAVHGFWPEFEVEYDKWTKAMLNGWTPSPRIGKVDGDQSFLMQKVWPVIKDNHIAHDDKKSKTGNELPFKVKLPGKRFIGQQYNEKGKSILV